MLASKFGHQSTRRWHGALIQVPKLGSDQLCRDAKKLNIDIRAGSVFTTRRLYRDCFRLNAGWALTDAFDDERTVEQALKQLLQIVRQAFPATQPAQ